MNEQDEGRHLVTFAKRGLFGNMLWKYRNIV